MVKIQKISRPEPTLGFTEFDIYQCYKSSFESSEPGRLHALFPFKSFCQSTGLVSSCVGRPSLFSPEGKVALMLLKSYTGFSDADLVSHLNGNIHFQLFCGVYIHPSRPLTKPQDRERHPHRDRGVVKRETSPGSAGGGLEALPGKLARLHDGRDVLRELFTLSHQPEIVVGKRELVATIPVSLFTGTRSTLPP